MRRTVMTFEPEKIGWLALFIAVFFTLSADGQYFFIRHQINRVVHADLDDAVDDLANAVTTNYDGTFNIREYNKAYVDASNYFVILKDGLILDGDVLSEAVVGEILPPVEFSGTRNAHPGEIFDSVSELGEKWRLLATHIRGGQVILGFTEFDEVKDQDQKLRRNAEFFGSSLDDAKLVNRSKLDNNINYAVIDDSGKLMGAAGRIPLKTNPLLVGNIHAGLSQTSVNGKVFALFNRPILRGHNETVGTVIAWMDVSREHRVFDLTLMFQAAMAGASWVVFFAFGLHYWGRAEAQKRRMRQAFQNYFSPQIMEAILKEPETLNGQRKEVTILFSDIRSFTSLSETLPPQRLTRMLQEYFTEMTEEIIATDGIVDKFIGDAIMAFWGAPIDQPDQADRAVTAALNMTQRLKALQAKWKSEGLPAFDMGIGINLGIATVGNMGSTKRYDYTLIGDAVNAASRLEELNKEHHSHIIISESTKQQLTIPVQVRDLGVVPVQGRAVPIKVYEVQVVERQAELEKPV